LGVQEFLVRVDLTIIRRHLKEREEKMKPLIIFLAFLFAVSSFALASADDNRAQNEAAIRKTIESYVAAYNRGDAKTLAGHWTKDGSFVVPSGEEFSGRERLEAAFMTLFGENKGVKLEVTPLAIYVESPNEAIEEGVAVTTRSGAEPEKTRYVAAYVKEGGSWRISRLRELFPLGASSPHYDKLKPLAWLIGDWIDADSSGKLETRCHWSKNKNFLVRSFSATVGGQAAFAGKQLIAWDPSSKQIRSWVFDSNGGFGEGTWSKRGDSWVVNSVVVLNTGEKASSVNILKPLDDKSYSWQSTGREIGGELLPNTPTITVVRRPAGSAPRSSGKK
jgi:uncharacterized protein (TIGR02246 family)